MGSCIGWDVGGAHLKGARAERGRIVAVAQVPSRLWLGLGELEAALAQARARLGEADRHAATMTGELADGFASRAEGVGLLAALLARHLSPLRLYGGRAGWLDPAAAAAHVGDIASANWHASAALAARSVPDALLVDIGSTTTDLVPIAAGRVAAAGYTDAERLAAGELVYTGIARSFVMALAPRAPFAGAWTPLACEHFATSADVWRLLGELPEGADQMPTADGRDKSMPASRARLARMVGRDAADADETAWRALAAWFAEAQLRQIADAAMLVASRGVLSAGAVVVGAGVGRHLAARVAARLGWGFVGFGELVGGEGPSPNPLPQGEGLSAPSPALAGEGRGEGASGAAAADCAPAVAMALLGDQPA